MFHTIPLPFLPTHLKSLQGIINAFIWQHKNLESRRTLSSPSTNGGMGAPNVQAYYRAVVLDQLREWWSPASNKTWIQIESMAVHANMKHTLTATLLNLKPQHHYLHSVMAALRVWSASIQRATGLPRSIISRLPIQAIELISPDLPLKLWTQKGLTNLGQLMSTSGIHPFLHLQQHTISLPQHSSYTSELDQSSYK